MDHEDGKLHLINSDAKMNETTHFGTEVHKTTDTKCGVNGSEGTMTLVRLNHKKRFITKLNKGINEEKDDNNPKIDRHTCEYCLKSFTKGDYKRKHIRRMHEKQPKVKKTPIDDNSKVNRLTCQYCLKSFTNVYDKQKHVRNTHEIEKSNSNSRCVECDIGFKNVTKLREHLQEHHSLNMAEEELHFPDMTAFKKWKCEIERENLCSYILAKLSRKHLLGPKYFYVCHRSGKYLSRIVGEPKKMPRVGGTIKLGIVCTAAIYCQERPNEVYVKYVPQHYGHGKETSFVQLSPEEQTAIQESVSKGVPFENLLLDIKDSQSKDTVQLDLLKKRDARRIRSAFKAEECNAGISDAESIENWVRHCCQMEESPILFYKQQNIGYDQEEFMLVIMTEFQKHILLSSKKDMVCLDSLHRQKNRCIYLTILLVMDEFDIPFPVAFCISNKVDKNVIELFFISIKESAGSLSTKYFMSDSETYFYDSWVNIMNDDPRWLWSIWYVDSKIRTQLKHLKGNVAKKAEVCNTMRQLLECQNENVFSCMFKSFIDGLNNDPLSKQLGNFIMSKFGSNTEMWASCYRKEIDLSTNIHLEVMHRTFKYCCQEGRKKRLDKFLFVLMKLLKCKMLDRLSNMLDKEKLNLAIEAINMCHIAGLEISTQNMTALSDNMWLIQTKDNKYPIYITKEIDKCPDHCSLRCDECDICVHQYTCSCVQNIIDANMCMHIHAVVWKLLTPHFSPAPSPPPSAVSIEESIESEISPVMCADLYECVLKRMHDVYKKVKANRCNLNKETLTLMMNRFNECVDLCSGIKVDEPVAELIAAPTNNECFDLCSEIEVDEPVTEPIAAPTNNECVDLCSEIEVDEPVTEPIAAPTKKVYVVKYSSQQGWQIFNA